MSITNPSIKILPYKKNIKAHYEGNVKFYFQILKRMTPNFSYEIDNIELDLKAIWI